jgi:hypothetical protein
VAKTSSWYDSPILIQTPCIINGHTEALGRRAGEFKAGCRLAGGSEGRQDLATGQALEDGAGARGQTGVPRFRWRQLWRSGQIDWRGNLFNQARAAILDEALLHYGNSICFVTGT